MSGITIGRLSEERKNWRKDHPAGFFARPSKNADGSMNLMEWETGIPGKENTDWEGGVFTVTVNFPAEYPVKPPTCAFEPPIFHPNVFDSGEICLSILNDEEGGWSPAITIKQVLIAIQDLLTNPNPKSPANGLANALYLKDKEGYKRRVRKEAAKFAGIA